MYLLPEGEGVDIKIWPRGEVQITLEGDMPSNFQVTPELGEEDGDS
jgi:hypothetical protein